MVHDLAARYGTHIVNTPTPARATGGTTMKDMLLSWWREARPAVVWHLSGYTEIGRKVAACIALMSLDQLGEIPMDTYVYKIATRYRPELAATK